MTDGTWAEGVEKFARVRAMKRLAAQVLAEEERHFARGGIVHGPGATDNDLAGMWPLGVVASAQMARESLQGIRDAIDSAADKGLAYRELMRDNCQSCGQRIRVMINRGAGWCSEQCRKRLAGEWEDDE